MPNLNEFFVHHEDVRRANGRGPRSLPTGMDDALWSNVRGAAWLLARRLRGVGLELRNITTGATVTARHGRPTVRIDAEPGELLLYLFGRTGVAEVQLHGSPDGVEAVKKTAFGM